MQASRRDMLKLALEVSVKAGNLLRRRFHAGKIHSTKKAADELCTAADRESEELIRDFLEKRDPQNGFCGEESGFARPKAPNWWCVDPLDGTTNFIRGIPFFSVSIAYMEKGVPVVGAVYDPVQHLLYYAQKGKGAFFQRRPMRSDRDVAAARGRSITLYTLNLGHGGKMPQWFKRWGECSKLRNLGSMALQLCYVAHGKLDYCVSDRAHLWDIAAGGLILEESGGRLVDFHRKPVFPLQKPWPKIGPARFPFVAVSKAHRAKIRQ